MRYIEAPLELDADDATNYDSVFLAGGITGCPDWQKAMVGLLEDTHLVLLNPRRENFPIDDPDAAQAQIEWEHHHLRRADAILFWFSGATLNPIVLYELGAWSMTQKPIFVGMDRDYARRQDVEIQTALARPEVPIVYSLEELADCVRNHFQREGSVDSNELHTVYFDEKIEEREKSIRVRIDDQAHWFPKSEIRDFRQEDKVFAFEIPVWLALRKNLV